MNAHESEAEDNNRLRKATEHIAYCKDAETKAIGDLVDARKTLTRAREKHALLFEECQNRAVARRKAGLIQNVAGY